MSRAAASPGRGGQAAAPAAACGSDDDWSAPEEAPAGEVLHSRPKLSCCAARDSGLESFAQQEILASELTLLEQVATGSTAEVYRGLWRNRVVAIKELKTQSWYMSDSEKTTFLREMAVLGRVNHPNLVHMFGVTIACHPWRIVTEFCEGGTLWDLLYEQQDIDITWALRLKVCKDIAAAMDYLHRFPPPIVHRDLKSLNMLLAKELHRPSSSSGSPHRGSQSADLPVIKVADFGLARMKEKPGSAWGKMTNRAGTLNWMAPEVLAGSLYDERVDVYSYAMVVYEVSCLEIPFEDEDPNSLAGLIIQGLRPSLKEAWPPDGPPLLARLMVACWAHEPQRRPCFEDVLATLEAISTSLPGAAGAARA